MPVYLKPPFQYATNNVLSCAALGDFVFVLFCLHPQLLTINTSDSVIMLRSRELLCLASLCRRLSSLNNKKQSLNTEHIDISEEVRFALQHNKPVVALESTIITHGIPFPENVEFSTNVEQTVRQQVLMFTVSFLF